MYRTRGARQAPIESSEDQAPRARSELVGPSPCVGEVPRARWGLAVGLGGPSPSHGANAVNSPDPRQPASPRQPDSAARPNHGRCSKCHCRTGSGRQKLGCDRSPWCGAFVGFMCRRKARQASRGSAGVLRRTGENARELAAETIHGGNHRGAQPLAEVAGNGDGDAPQFPWWEGVDDPKSL